MTSHELDSKIQNMLVAIENSNALFRDEKDYIQALLVTALEYELKELAPKLSSRARPTIFEYLKKAP